MITLTLEPQQSVMALNTKREGVIDSLPETQEIVLKYDVPVIVKFDDGQIALVRPSHLADIHR